MAHMLLFGFRQEHIEFRDNLVHAFCRDMRTLRVCHANRQTACASGADLQPPSYGALQITCRENGWLTSISFPCEASHPESHDSSLRRIISRCHAIVVKKKVGAQRVDNSHLETAPL